MGYACGADREGAFEKFFAVANGTENHDAAEAALGSMSNHQFIDDRIAEITAAQRGADGIIASNHGGRQLDGAIEPLKALPAKWIGSDLKPSS